MLEGSVRRISTRPFQDWGYRSDFERCRDSFSGKRGVNDGRDERDQGGETGFNQSCGEKVS